MTEDYITAGKTG